MNNVSSLRKTGPRKRIRAADRSAAADRPASPAIVHDLETSTPYLIARTGIRIGQAFSNELRQFNISLTEWRVLAALRHRPHQRLSDLAANTSSDASTLSRTVEGLLQQGLLVRERSADDARAVALALTPEGMQLAERVLPLARLYERVLLSGIDPQQVNLLREMLNGIYANMATLSRPD